MKEAFEILKALKERTEAWKEKNKDKKWVLNTYTERMNEFNTLENVILLLHQQIKIAYNQGYSKGLKAPRKGNLFEQPSNEKKYNGWTKEAYRQIINAELKALQPQLFNACIEGENRILKKEQVLKYYQSKKQDNTNFNNSINICDIR